MRKAYLMFFLSTLFFCYEFMLRVSLGVMANELMLTFSISATVLGLLGSVFFQAYAWMQIPVGIIFDRFSTRKTLAFSCFICAVGTLIFSLATTVPMLMISRILIGAGAAFGFVGTLKIAEQWLPATRFALLTGMLATIGFLGAVASDNALTYLFQHFGWRQVFLYAALLGVILSILIFVLIKDVQVRHAFPHVIKFRAYLQFVARLCTNRFILLNSIIGLCLYFPTSAFAELWGKSYLQVVLKLTSVQATLSVSMIFLGWAVGSLIQGWVYDKIQQTKLLFTVNSLLAALFICIVLYASLTSFYLIATCLFLFGLFSSCEIINFAYAKKNSSAEISATAMAFTNIFVILGGVFAQPVIGWLLDENWHGGLSNGIRIYSLTAYHLAFLVIPGMLCIAAILAQFLKDNHSSLP